MRKHGMLWLLIALATPVLGDRAEFALGGEDGNPWTIPLALEGEEGGFYTVYGTDGQIIQTESVGTSPQWVGADTLINYADGAMTPSWVDPNLNLTHIVSWDQNGQSQVPFHDLGGNIRVTQGENSAFMGMTLPSTLRAYDGDRTRLLEPGERAELWVERTGPWVIEAPRALRAAGEDGVFGGRHWHDGFDGQGGADCC